MSIICIKVQLHLPLLSEFLLVKSTPLSHFSRYPHNLVCEFERSPSCRICNGFKLVDSPCWPTKKLLGLKVKSLKAVLHVTSFYMQNFTEMWPHLHMVSSMALLCFEFKESPLEVCTVLKSRQCKIIQYKTFWGWICTKICYIMILLLWDKMTRIRFCSYNPHLIISIRFFQVTSQTIWQSSSTILLERGVLMLFKAWDFPGWW